MSRWAEAFAAFSGGVDTADTSRQSERTKPDVSQCVASVTVAPEPTRLPTADRTLATWGEADTKRAAIVEHDGHVPPVWAAGVAQLDPDRPPSDVPLKRWQQFIGDARLFLDRWGGRAAALGWEPHDLFGCDRDRPFARIDQWGLLWLLNGSPVVILAEDDAAIETTTGTRQTWRRKPAEPGRVLAWDLA